MQIAVVVARFNEIVTSRLLDGCRDELRSLDVPDPTVVEVPGARELPVVCSALAESGRYGAVVALGCVIRGETSHSEFVAGEASRGCGQVAVDTGVPVIFGVLTTETTAQALERAGGKMGNKGRDAARSAVEMARLIEELAK